MRYLALISAKDEEKSRKKVNPRKRGRQFKSCLEEDLRDNVQANFSYLSKIQTELWIRRILAIPRSVLAFLLQHISSSRSLLRGPRSVLAETKLRNLKSEKSSGKVEEKKTREMDTSGL